MRFAERRDARIRQHQLGATYWIDGKWIFLNDRRGGYKLKRAGPTARVGRGNPHAPLGEAMSAIYLNARWHCSIWLQPWSHPTFVQRAVTIVVHALSSLGSSRLVCICNFSLQSPARMTGQ